MNLGLVVIIVMQPSLVQKGEQRIQDWLATHLPDFFANDAQLAAQTKVILSDVVKPWKPYPSRSRAPTGKAKTYNQTFDSLKKASESLNDGDTLYIGPGTYKEAMTVTANYVKIIGDGHVHFQEAQTKGKATFVIRGNGVDISNIECSGVEVSDGNGACVRLKGKNLRLDNVYFHDSQQGLLTGDNPGTVLIKNSWFERLGHAGTAHGVYVGGGALKIYRSIFLASRDQGHEIKSRALSTIIDYSIIASLDGVDSRLIDISVGGKLSIENSILEQGPVSSNSDVIGYALEKKPKHKVNTISLINNTIIMERLGGSRLLNLGIEPSSLEMFGNVIVSPNLPESFGENDYYRSRKEANLLPYPHLN